MNAACANEGCDQPVMAHLSRIESAGKPVQLIVRPPVIRMTGWLSCLHHTHVAVDEALMDALRVAP